MILNYQIRKMGFENVVAFESEFLTIGGVVIHKTKAIHGDSDKVVEKMGEVTGYIFEFPGEKKNVIGHDVTFFDIQSTKAKQYGFCMDLGKGKSLTCCGDEPYDACEEKYARNSEWLLHEAFCLYFERDIFDPYEKHHSTVKDACELAERLNVKNLLLYHTEDKNLTDRKTLYLEEGSRYYHGKLFIPDDLESLEL